MKQNNDPDFESFLGSIIDWNDYRGDVDDFIKSLPIENDLKNQVCH